MRHIANRWVPRALSLLLLFLVVFPTGRAEGAFLTYAFAGRVDSVDASLSGTFSVGQTLNGQYTFDSTIAARAGSTSTAAVFDALKALSFSIGGYSGSTTGAPEIQVDNNPTLPNHDRYAVVSRASDGLIAPAVAGLPINFFGFRLDDSTNTVFSNALVLPTNLNLSDFDNRQFFLFFGSITSPSVVSGTITSLTPVPEPSSLGTIGIGLLGVLGYAGVAKRRSKAAA